MTPAGNLPADSLAAGSPAADSAATDSAETLYGIVMEPVASTTHQGIPRGMPPAATSWMLAGIVLLFCLVCFRFRNNLRYLRTLFTEMGRARERGNMFDDTARETFFMFLLNILFCACGGILLYYSVMEPKDGSLSFEGSKLALCCAVAAGWEIFMAAAYIILGTAFLSPPATKSLLMRFSANQGLLGLALLIPSMLLIFYPAWTAALIAVSTTLFIVARLIFIRNCSQIFFQKNSSRLVFLCYICSLEIIPVIISYNAARIICG